MATESQKTIRIKWIRSGIGFPWRQKQMVRSLGLRRLNQVVVRPDTPQIRGLVAGIPHLVTVVEEAPKSVWGAMPEYVVHAPAPEAAPKKAPKRAVQEAAPEEKEVPAATVAAAGEPVTEHAPASLAKAEVAEHARPAKTKKAAEKPVGGKKAKPAKAAEKEKKEKKPEKAKGAKGSKTSKTGKK